jgi:predicted XRE-type DNA-binding protein
MTNENFETSSGNIFADLKLPNSEERLVKAKLAIQINLLIKNKGLNQKEAAQLLGTDQAKITALLSALASKALILLP